MKKNNFLTKAFTLLFVALFSLTGARAQKIVSDIKASHISTNSADLSWTGNNTYLRYRALTGKIHTYGFEDHTFQGWTTIDLTTNGSPNYADGLKWVVYSTNTVYTSYAPGPDGHNSNEMLTSGSYVSNSNSEYSNQDITPNNYLVSPKVKLGGAISFWAKGLDPVDFAENFSVYVSTSGNTVTSSWGSVNNPFLNNVIASNIKTTAVWTQYVFDLGKYDGQEGYIAIRHHNCTGQDQLCIDDIVIREPATSDSWSSNVTLSSGTSYSFPNNLSATTAYQVEVGTRSGNNYTWNKGTCFLTTNDNPAPTELYADPVEDVVATVNWWGISPQYRVYYRKDAQDGPLYFFEDFEDGLSKWTRFIGRGGQTPTISGYAFNTYGFDNYSSEHFDTHSGEGAPVAWSWHGHTNYYANNWLISPKITMGSMVKFWVQVSPGYPDKFEVLFYPTNANSVTQADTTNFTVVLRELAPAERYHGWKRVIISLKELGLENYIDKPGFVAIHHKLYGGEGGNYFHVDDFGIYEDDIPGEVDWTTVLTTGPELTKELQKLIPNSLYEYKVVGIKDGVDSPESVIDTFTTKVLNTYDLPDAKENSELVAALVGEKDKNINLTNRIIYGGKWNTLYLPFDVNLAGSPLADADVRELTGASFDAETQVLTLTFSQPLTKLTANVPYIIKPKNNISEPRFRNVTIRGNMIVVPYTLVEGQDMFLWFRGTYDPLSFKETDRRILFMNAKSNLVYPVNGSYLNSQRAYFEFKGIHAADPIAELGIKELVVNLDEDPTGISELFGIEEEAGTWFDLNGRKLSGKPAQKGIYINNGKKKIIK